MSLPLLLLRPQPGNDATAERAKAMGLDVIQLPLFEVIAAHPTPLPDGPFDALLITSANGARFGKGIFPDHPAYAVGESTAQAARDVGFRTVFTGGGDAASTIPMIVTNGHGRILHLCGADVRAFDPQGLSITRHIVYRSVERDEAALRPQLDSIVSAVAAIHSPRAGRRFAQLVPPARRHAFHVAAISAAAASECGTGWASLHVAEHPDDTALLHCVEPLCIRAG